MPVKLAQHYDKTNFFYMKSFGGRLVVLGSQVLTFGGQNLKNDGLFKFGVLTSRLHPNFYNL